jgi:hypothetical protein
MLRSFWLQRNRADVSGENSTESFLLSCDALVASDHGQRQIDLFLINVPNRLLPKVAPS